ncbi:hypothetical protein [Sphingobacterium humi]|uniref:DUF4251 domain-containing protein n=1 Tax=Sphingobacterium humi TaxID=1796905 RepID=A0A6N8L1L7_9SPHI|nr:hypothetical protein [Sphingobacterium humi]MVZ63610.1 hypothetical protein [Sphingobacterium humi]
MKMILFVLALCFSAEYLKAQDIEKFTVVTGQEHYGTKKIPTDILKLLLGTYKYDFSDNGEPIAELSNGNKGRFQMHGTPPYPIDYWIETNAEGELLIQRGEGNPNFRIVLIVKYGPNSETNGGKWNGDYNRIPVTFDIENKKADIFSERYKNL